MYLKLFAPISTSDSISCHKNLTKSSNVRQCHKCQKKCNWPNHLMWFVRLRIKYQREVLSSVLEIDKMHDIYFSSVVSLKNSDRLFLCISPFKCHDHGHGSQCQGWNFSELVNMSSAVLWNKWFLWFCCFQCHPSQCQGWNLDFQKLSRSCRGRRELSLKNLPTNHFRKTRNFVTPPSIPRQLIT